jgi:hypothetical protein
MAYIPLAQELSTKYTLTGPNGVVATLNDSTDANYVGFTTEITGLDSPEVRESAQDLVESDGGAHGYFFFGRRPITMTVNVSNAASVAARSTRIDLLRRATLAMRGDATLTWTLSTDPTMSVFVPVRRQQPFRESGGWVKEIQVALVSQYAGIFSNTQVTSAVTASGTGVVLENKGSWPAYPILRIAGTSVNPTVTNNTTGEVFTTTGLTVASGETVEFDMLNHTGVFTAGARNGQSANRFIDFATSKFPTLATGNSTFTLAGGGNLTVIYRHTWV